MPALCHCCRGPRARPDHAPGGQGEVTIDPQQLSLAKGLTRQAEIKIEVEVLEMAAIPVPRFTSPIPEWVVDACPSGVCELEAKLSCARCYAWFDAGMLACWLAAHPFLSASGSHAYHPRQMSNSTLTGTCGTCVVLLHRAAPGLRPGHTA